MQAVDASVDLEVHATAELELGATGGDLGLAQLKGAKFVSSKMASAKNSLRRPFGCKKLARPQPRHFG